MEIASIHEIKQELKTLSKEDLVSLCLRFSKFRKENKELLNYLLFHAHHEAGYVDDVKSYIDNEFKSLHRENVYYIKKSLRRILRLLNKQVKFSGIPQTELELRIFFCSKILSERIPLHQSTVLKNLYDQQLKKIETVFNKLPEDLQADYSREVSQLKK